MGYFHNQSLEQKLGWHKTMARLNGFDLRAKEEGKRKSV
jgi:hypothetical protein